MKSIIEIKELSKMYKLGVYNAKSLREEAEALFARFRGKRTRQINLRNHSASSSTQMAENETEFWALRDVSFEVHPGEVIGIIGRNGAGKSTLLKILSRITEPTYGEAIMRGRVASLLEVGTGFHPELTGRENIFLNGAILGMTKREIKSKFDEIVSFAEVEKFIDTPVKRYSSGMYVRLAFAVAAHLEPEILIVDEVLAVGDASFQKKCLGKMQEVSGRDGRTVLFVSHNMTAVQSLCSRSVLMKSGKLAFIGDTEECVRHYLMEGGQIANEKRWEHPDTKPGNERVRLNSIRAISKRQDQYDSALFDMTTPVDVEIQVSVLKKCHFHVTLHFTSDQGITAFTTVGLPPCNNEKESDLGNYRFVCHIPANLLNEGCYSIRFLLVEKGTRVAQVLDDVIGFDVKDMRQRDVGSYHGREPGPVHPQLNWTICNFK